MKAMMLTGIRQMEMREVPDPTIAKRDDVLIRMDAVGVCGSDVHYYTTGRIGSQVVEYPFAVGHECAGTVVAVGDGVTMVQPGDAVAIEPAMTCGNCDQCRVGRSNTCRHNRFLGCPGQAEGSLSEFIVMPEVCCLPVQKAISPGLATIAEPLAIGIYAVDLSVPPPGASVGILGMGPIGLSVMLPALRAGVGQVYCTDRIDERLALAQRAGACYVGNVDQQDVVADILEQTGTGLDVVFECCGQQAAIDQAVDLLKPGGKLMMIGIPEVNRISFEIDKFRRKEICLQNVRRQQGRAHDAVALIENGELDVGQMITHTFPFERSRDAFELVADYADGVVKAIIDFSQPEN